MSILMKKPYNTAMIVIQDIRQGASISVLTA